MIEFIDFNVPKQEMVKYTSQLTYLKLWEQA